MFLGKDAYMLWCILEYRSASETARLLEVSQPCVSIFLKRCRDNYTDELVDFKTRELTPTGEMLKSILSKVAPSLEYL